MILVAQSDLGSLVQTSTPDFFSLSSTSFLLTSLLISSYHIYTQPKSTQLVRPYPCSILDTFSACPGSCFGLPSPLCQRQLQVTVNRQKALLQSRSLDLLCTHLRFLMVLIASLLLQFLAAVQQTALIPTFFFFFFFLPIRICT